jgi:hypothetical protein
MSNIPGIVGSLGAGIALLVTLAGCGDREAEGREAAAPAPQPGTVVDSILPIEEEVRRFAEAAGPTPTALESDWTSLEVLAREFLSAIAARDTAFLASAMVTPAEFITFYFPHSIYMEPPYQMDPAIIWFQMTSGSDRGLTRALARFEGQELEMTGHTCAEPLEQGPNRVWESCKVRFRQVGGEEREIRLFGPVLERDGYVKFLSYGNDL